MLRHQFSFITCRGIPSLICVCPHIVRPLMLILCTLQRSLPFSWLNFMKYASVFFLFLGFAMLTVKQLRESTRSGPYSKPLRGKVVAVGPQKPYTPAGSTDAKTMAYLSMAQDDAWLKATLYDTSKLPMLQPGSSVMLKNFVFRNGSLLINEKTVIGRTTDVLVNPTANQEAYNAVFPPSKMEEIAKLVSATGSSLWSVEAMITKVGVVVSNI